MKQSQRKISRGDCKNFLSYSVLNIINAVKTQIANEKNIYRKYNKGKISYCTWLQINKKNINTP